MGHVERAVRVDSVDPQGPDAKFFQGVGDRDEGHPESGGDEGKYRLFIGRLVGHLRRHSGALQYLLHEPP